MPPFVLPAPSADLPSQMIGLWVLVSREDYDAAGNRHLDPIMAADPLGTLSFSAGHFSAQFMRRDRSGTPVAMAGSGVNNSVAVNGYDGYFGSYTVDAAKGTMATLLTGSVSAANVGLTFVRDVRVIGDHLYIQLATQSAAGVPITRTNTFVRG